MTATQYDFIFLGCGCASLSVVMRMIDSGQFHNKKILLIDKDEKIKNDRTWCFWAKKEGFFEQIIYKKWQQLFFKSETQNISLECGNYEYKMIRGIDFYNHCFQLIRSQKNIDILFADISLDEIKNDKIKINNEVLEIKKEAIILNSIYQTPKKVKGKFYLLQHFKGWTIETGQPVFDKEKATLMDFNISQAHGDAFIYLLPFSENKALIEYTIFSETTLTHNEYNIAIEKYLKENLKIGEYKIIGSESGIIPMTNADFVNYKNDIYYIGTAGGQTKPSTGYTFNFIQKQSDIIVRNLIKNKAPFFKKPSKNRFHFYDSVLLHILSKKILTGKKIFSILFEKNQAKNIFNFLDNETSIFDEIKIFRTLPTEIFLRAGLKEVLKYLS